MGTPELVASSTTLTLPGTAPPQKRIASVCANETHPCVGMLPTCLSHLGPLQKGQGQWSRSCWQQLCGSWGAGRGRVCRRSWAGTWDTWAWGRKGQHPWGGVPPGCSGCAPHGCPGHPGWWTAGCTHRTSASPPEDKVRQSAVKELHTSLTASPPEDKVRQSTVKELHTSRTASPPEDKVRQSAVKELHTSHNSFSPWGKRQSRVKELHTSHNSFFTWRHSQTERCQGAAHIADSFSTWGQSQTEHCQGAAHIADSFSTWRHSQTEHCQGATHIAQQLLHLKTQSDRALSRSYAHRTTASPPEDKDRAQSRSYTHRTTASPQSDRALSRKHCAGCHSNCLEAFRFKWCVVTPVHSCRQIDLVIIRCRQCSGWKCCSYAGVISFCALNDLMNATKQAKVCT